MILQVPVRLVPDCERLQIGTPAAGLPDGLRILIAYSMFQVPFRSAGACCSASTGKAAAETMKPASNATRFMLASV
jgi:hypothetical protein